MNCIIEITIVVFLKILCIQSRMLPIEYMTRRPTSVGLDPRPGPELPESGKTSNEKVIELGTSYDENNSSEDYSDYGAHSRTYRKQPKKPCGVVVLSNMPNMQSLLRKYRYDANGVLIPSSVKYFIKLPRGLESSPILVPLNEKAFSPLGGFVRYYKEVPPIPHSWQYI